MLVATRSFVFSGALANIRKVKEILPGLGLCLAITVIALVLQSLEIFLIGQPYIEALIGAIIIGMIVRNLWQPGERYLSGIAFSGKFILELAVALLGFTLSFNTVAALGPFMIGGIAFIVAAAIGVTYAVGRLVGLPNRMSFLIACGNSICGNSAIAAVAPIIGAKTDDIAASLSFTAFLGVIVVLALPALVPLLGLSLTQYGVLAGLTVYAVPQVLAATLPIGALSNQVGTVVKLVRVLMLGPVILGVSFFQASKERKQGVNDTSRRSQQLLPWFIAAFVLAFLARSVGIVPEFVPPITAHAATLLTAVAMAALGLGVDMRAVARTGPRIVVAVTISLLSLGIMSLGLIKIGGVS